MNWDAIFFFFAWLARQAEGSDLGYGVVENLAMAFDSWILAGIVVLAILSVSRIPNEGIMLFIAALTGAAISWLHLDAAYWRDSLPESPGGMIFAVILTLTLPIASFMLTRSEWRKHS